jgi:predicted enzyme related to lactoylglutathione lyase
VTDRDEAPIGAPCWADVVTSDVERARSFYGQVFGWEAQLPDPELGGYFQFTNDGVPTAGCMAADAGDPMRDTWTSYLATADARATVAAVEADGQAVFVGATEVGDMGTMAVVVDPGGATIGLWQAGRHRGFGRYGVPGTPGWFDLQTRHYDACVTFYRDLLGWHTHTLSDTPEFRYTTLKVGDEELAGIMDAATFLGDGVPAHWTIVFAVDDTDRTLAQVVSLGGGVVVPASDAPWGRLATVSDPQGAAFALVSNP